MPTKTSGGGELSPRAAAGTKLDGDAPLSLSVERRGSRPPVREPRHLTTADDPGRLRAPRVMSADVDVKRRAGIVAGGARQGAFPVAPVDSGSTSVNVLRPVGLFIAGVFVGAAVYRPAPALGVLAVLAGAFAAVVDARVSIDRWLSAREARTAATFAERAARRNGLFSVADDQRDDERDAELADAEWAECCDTDDADEATALRAEYRRGGRS